MTADSRTIVIVATGGTIATRVDPVLKAPVPALTGDDIVEAVPRLKALARIEVRNFSNIPSPWMGPDHWPALAGEVEAQLARPDVAGVVVTHGTDTIDQTALFLDLTLSSDKPVVLVGAQRNASDPEPDGPRNLVDAVRQILDPQSAGQGVTVTMNQRINAARYVRKTHTNNVHTFTSGDLGHLGYVDLERVTFHYRLPPRRTLPLPQALPRVDLVAMYAGADGDYVRLAVDRGARGIVIDGYGIGHVNEPMHDAIAQALARGVAVVIASKVPHGRAQPLYGFKGGGKLLEALGAIYAGDLSADKARVVLMLALANGITGKALADWF